MINIEFKTRSLKTRCKSKFKLKQHKTHANKHAGVYVNSIQGDIPPDHVHKSSHDTPRSKRISYISDNESYNDMFVSSI